MAWTVHSWSAECKEGLIVSPHFGPLAFGPRQNVMGTTDFVVGEEVIVEVSGAAPSLTIDKVFAARQRQPEGTEDPCFVAMNGHATAWVEEESETTFRIGAGECCEGCGASARVTFWGKADVHWPNHEVGLGWPLFRVATVEEMAALTRPVPPDHRVYCIVTEHGHGPDGPHVYVVARGVAVG